MNSYFLDTYAMMEILKSNPSFERFRNTPNTTSNVNLLELHYIISREFGLERANQLMEKLKNIISEINLEDVKRASAFRLKKAKKKR